MFATKQRKPDSVFVVRVCPVYRVHGCAEKQAQESRGMFGFHSFTSCPNCKVTFEGWQMWGSNGHMQASAATRDSMVFWVGHKAKEQWCTKDGRTMGYKFENGSAVYYKGF